ncbi:hypothetical protein FA13DRAFT_1738769 [Coprinellus micaceus]|uniref:Uncharacterized protein n=1 Tax=Coprinellus micaceus TaxID=71717 RepID=A0A4Y7STI4_COPMI|nr:hypothetical protein FA13DRAFT_1738769 [Coprinellus micaceus]
MHTQDDSLAELLALITGHDNIASFADHAIEDPSSCCQRVLSGLQAVVRLANTAPVEERFVSIKHTIIALVDHFNASLPISRLPPEILSEIFLIHRSRVVKYDQEEDLSWIGITHVCRHWRAVGLSCTTLWSSVTFVNCASVEAMLSRSGTSPLSLNFTDQSRLSRYATFVDALPKALSRGHRPQLRSLKLHDIDSRVLRSVILFCAQGVPLLEDLSLHCNDSFVWPPIDVRSLRNVAPTLKFLRLSRCSIPWNSLPLSTLLVKLALVAPSDDNSCRPSSGNFASSMKELSCLEILVLDGYLPSDAYPLSPEPVLTLAQLRTLELTDSAEYVASLLRAVSICDVESLSIGLKNPRLNREAEDIRLVIRQLKGSWNLLNKLRRPSCRLLPASGLIIEQSIGCASCEIMVDLDRTRSRRWAGDGASLTVSLETTNPSLSRLLLSLVNEVDFRELKRISAYGDIENSSWDEDAWSTLFMHANRVTAIHLGGDFTAEAILGMLITGLTNDPLQRLPFLSTIKLSNTDLGKLGWAGITSSSLLAVLSMRRRISALCVEDCLNFGQSQVDQLEWKFPLDVDWDGYTEYTGLGEEESDGDDSETNEEDEQNSEDDSDDSEASGDDDSDASEMDEEAGEGDDSEDDT